MGERPVLAVVTLGMLLVLLVAVALSTWWTDQRLQRLEERLTETERLGPKIEGFKQEVEKDLTKVGEIADALTTLQKTVAPLAKMDRSLDALSEKMGKDVAPEVAKISDILTNLATTSSQVKGVSEALATMRQQMDKIDKQGTDNTATLTEMNKNLQAAIKEVSDAQADLVAEVAKLETEFKSLGEPQGALSETSDQVKALGIQLNEVQKTLEWLKRQLEDVQRKLPEPRRPGSAS